MKKKTCMLCHSQLIRTKTAQVKGKYYPNVYGAKRVDYSGALYENEYACTNPNCVFYDAKEVQAARDRIAKANPYRLNTHVKHGFKKQHKININKLAERWSSI